MKRAGFVLVGGRSARMGHDKARLAIGSRLLVEDVAEAVKQAAGSVALVGAADRYRDLALERLDDLQPGLGPLSGIEAALASGRGEWNLIVACDLPELAQLPLERLFTEAETRPEPCLLLSDAAGNAQPLCGIWSSACLPHVRRALNDKRLRVTDLLRALPAGTLAVSRPIPNINTPAEWLAWRSSRAASDQ